MKLKRPAGFEPLFRTLPFLIFVPISSGVISSRVALAVTDEVQIFRDAFAVSNFAKVEESIAQYRRSSKSLPKDAVGKALLHYAIQVYSGDQARFVRILLNAGVDANARAWEDATPRHFVARADAKTVADLTKLPFLFDGKPGTTPDFRKSISYYSTLKSALALPPRK